MLLCCNASSKDKWFTWRPCHELCHLIPTNSTYHNMTECYLCVLRCPKTSDPHDGTHHCGLQSRTLSSESHELCLPSHDRMPLFCAAFSKVKNSTVVGCCHELYHLILTNSAYHPTTKRFYSVLRCPKSSNTRYTHFFLLLSRTLSSNSNKLYHLYLTNSAYHPSTKCFCLLMRCPKSSDTHNDTRNVWLLSRTLSSNSHELYLPSRDRMRLLCVALPTVK